MKIERSESAVVLAPESPAGAAVVWLHGLGADGNDFVPIVGELELPKDHGIRFIFPHAPVRPITINNGMPMRGWYDIPSLARLDEQDEAGIRDSERIVRTFIQREIDSGISASKIVLAGFSQGGAITLHAGLRYPQRLAGLMPLSTYLPLNDKVAAERSPANADVPILMCHGQFDPVLPMQMGQYSREYLQSLGYTIDWHEYPMQHQVCPEEIDLIGTWLRDRLL